MKLKSIKNNSAQKIRYYTELGKISSNILHDILNPITGLILYLDMISDGQDSNLKNFLIPVKDTSGTIKDFIRYIDNYLNNPSETQIINLEKMILNVINLFKPKTIKLGVKINFIKNSDRNLIIGNPLKIFQILLNLISNGLDSFDYNQNNNKEIIIETRFENKILSILIRDNGCGIDPKLKNNIFKTKFTTKESGTGIGLMNVYNIVKNNFESQIEFDSTPRKGTTFKIIFAPNRVIDNF